MVGRRPPRQLGRAFAQSPRRFCWAARTANKVNDPEAKPLRTARRDRWAPYSPCEKRPSLGPSQSSLNTFSELFRNCRIIVFEFDFVNVNLVITKPGNGVRRLRILDVDFVYT